MPVRSPTILAFALVILAAAAPASADCEPAGPVEQVIPKADVAFVGSVTATDGPVARFAVAEVWAGNIPDVVEVRGLVDRLAGRGGRPPVGEDDRQWVVGETYLVVPWVDGAVLRDSICTATTEWRPDLEPLRPASARIVETEPAGSVSVPSGVLAAGAVLLVIGVVSVLAFRGEERPR